MSLVRSCRYSAYAVAGVVGLVVSTSLLVLLILARVKRGWLISAELWMVRLILLRAKSANFA
jgi:hypothetical protein